MAKPVKYTIRRTARFSGETDQALVKKSNEMKLAPAVVIRIFVERALKVEKVAEPVV